jgi:excisionase family DNA binding protein
MEDILTSSGEYPPCDPRQINRHPSFSYSPIRERFMTSDSTAERTAILADRTLEPLVVPPKVAWRLLGCGNTHGYQLIANGELQSYTDGRSRRITMASIQEYIARRIHSADAATPSMPRRSALQRNHRVLDGSAPRAS